MSLTCKKVCFIGNARTGKTSMVLRLYNQTPNPKYAPTIGVEIHPYTTGQGATQVCYNIWDCAGQKRYEGLADGFYIGADIVILFIGGDEANPKTYGNRTCMEWKAMVDRVQPGASFYVVQRGDIETVRRILGPLQLHA